MRGRKPKPNAIKELSGSRWVNDGEPELTAKKPTCPSWLEPQAKALWKRIVPGLYAANIVKYEHREALAAYCQAYARWREAEEKVSRSSQIIINKEKGTLYRNPWLDAAQSAKRDMLRIATEFGLTPSALARLKVDEPEKAGGLADELFKVVKSMEAKE